MVYSATSASAVVGGANPMSYLERQGTYAVLGVAGLIVASRWKYTRLRPLAPTLVAVALIACAAVLVVAHPVNGARRWVSFGPAHRPAVGAREARVHRSGSRRTSRRRKPPESLKELWRPIGLLLGGFLLVILLEPDLGTAITLTVMVGAVLFVSGTRLRILGGGFALLCLGGAADGPDARVHARAPLQLPRPVAGPAGIAASRSSRRRSASAPATSSATGSARACRRSTSCPRRTPT